MTDKKDIASKPEPAMPETVEPRETAPQRVILDPSMPPVRSIIRVVVVTLLLLAVFDFARSILSSLTKLLFIVILAVFFAYLIDPLVKLIRSPFKIRNLERLMPRTLAIAIAYIFVFAVLSVAIVNLTPVISRQAREFGDSLPGYTTSVQQRVNEFYARFSRLRVSKNVQENITAKTTEYVGEAAASIGLIITSLPWLILVPILAFFFLKDVNLYRVTVLRFVPSGKWRARVESILFDVNKTLAAYTRAQVVSCVYIGLVSTIGFYIIGLDYAILLGIMAGVFEFVPLIGPLTIAVTAITVAFLESPWTAVYVIVFLGILRLSHDYITYPRIIREGIHLHPLAVILSVLAGEQVAGIPGVFISIPVVALLTVLYRHVIAHNVGSGLLGNWLEPKAEEKKIIEPR